jgi:hypothetical protein
MLSLQLEHWLDSLSLEQPVEVDGETVSLELHPDGAMLSLNLCAAATGAQLADALHTGFQSALEFDAGLALSEDGALVLSQWLPAASAWRDAAEALEGLLNQAAMWRAAMAPDRPAQAADPHRAAERIRQLFSNPP